MCIHLTVLSRILLVCTVLLAGSPARAFINPNFTPVHLVEGADQIATAKIAAEGKGARVSRLGMLKGPALETVVLDFGDAKSDRAKAALALVSGAGTAPCLVFLSGKGRQSKGYVHVAGKWLVLKAAGSNAFRAQEDAQMLATWHGGTDMLLRCVRYVLSSPDEADVPVAAGMDWREVVRIGKTQGTPTALAVLDLAGDGTPHLFVASAEGDVILRGTKGEGEVADVTQTRRLSSRSTASVWADFSGNGRLDLASYDGQKLTIWAQSEDGAFAASAPVAGVPGGIASLDAVSTGAGDRPGLLVSTPTGIVVMRNRGRAVFGKPLEIRPPRSLLKELGKPLRAVVADFTGDGWPDVIQPFERDGLLYRGREGHALGEPARCGVSSGRGGGTTAIGDLDANGLLDVLLCGDDGMKIYHNLGAGKFLETRALSGDVSYKARRFASWCDVGDFNCDARCDLLVTYHDEMIGLYFNRGFRSFGFAASSYSAIQDDHELNVGRGQKAGAHVDLDSDGAPDTVLIMSSGEVYCLYNDLGEEELLYLRAKVPLILAGPVSVGCRSESRAFGHRVARAGSLGAVFSIPEPGPYTLSWQRPGGPVQRAEVVLENKPIVFELKRVGD